MTGLRLIRYSFCALLGAVVAATIGACTHTGAIVAVDNLSDATTVMTLPVDSVREIRYRYDHSVDRDRVYESFIVVGDRLAPREMVYASDSYDYHGSRYPDSVHTVLDDRCTVTEISHEGYPVIRYRVGYTIEQELTFVLEHNASTHRFSEWGTPGELLQLSIRRNRRE